MVRFIYNIYAALIFVVLMLLVFPFTIIAAFFGRIKGGNFIYWMCTIWADIWFAAVFIFVRKIKDAPYNPGKKEIIVANHISYLDIPVIVKVFRKPMRVLGKIEMSKVPIFGFIYQRAIVTVDRKSAEGRARSIRLLRSIINKGISIFVFPEGTFNETGRPLETFYSGAFRLALETQTPIRPVLFLDTFDRMSYKKLLSLNPGKCRVVFLEEIPVAGMELKDHEQLKSSVYELMEKKLKEYQASWIKPNEQDYKNEY